jgi:uncharacterized membrane protein
MSSDWVIDIGVLLGILSLFGGLFIGASWLARRNSRSSEDAPRDRDEEALEILRQRYARGEISKTVYDSMRERLERRADK